MINSAVKLGVTSMGIFMELLQYHVFFAPLVCLFLGLKASRITSSGLLSLFTFVNLKSCCNSCWLAFGAHLCDLRSVSIAPRRTSDMP